MSEAEPSPAPAPSRRRLRACCLLLLIVTLLAWGLVRFWPAPPDADPPRPGAVRATPQEQRDLTVDGLRLRYVDVGPRDGEVALILPGHTSRIEEYDALIPRLAQRFRVVVFDYPGSGYSEKPVRDYTLAYYEDVTVALLDALHIERAHFLGGSQGGNVLLGLAARYPERCGRLVPWAPGSAWPASPGIARAGWLIAGYAPFWPMVEYQSTFWLGEDPRAADAVAETFAYYEEVMGPGFVRMYWGIALDTVRRSLFDVAPQVQAPTLLCWASRDATPYMAESIPRLAELMPRCETKRFESPHSIAAVHPEELAATIVEFLTRPEDELP